MLQADEGQMRQIVWNLATNGLRAMPDGGALTLARARRRPTMRPRGDQRADEGVGIAPEEMEEIFQPFRGGFERGTGLGLAMVHRIVSDYSGEVKVDSTKGAGTTVLSEITRRPDRCRGQVEAMPIDIQVPDSESATSTTPVARVLVVDDERSMRELLSIVLRRDGYDVLLASDGKVAVETLKRERVDVLITDIRMPEMSGVDVLREAKRIDPGIISIIMTAFASTDTAVDALRLGAADYVHKSPNAVNDLRLRVRKELERKRLQQENVLLKRQIGTPQQVRQHRRQQLLDGGGLRADRDDRADRQHRADHRRIRHRQGAGRARRARALVAAATGRSWRSTAARCPTRCWSRSCSATCAAPSPAPTRTRRGCSRSPRRGPSSSTKSAR